LPADVQTSLVFMQFNCYFVTVVGLTTDEHRFIHSLRVKKYRNSDRNCESVIE